MSKTSTRREVDFGWWTETYGRRARLTWALPGGRFFLFHSTGETEQFVAAISETAAREFVSRLDDQEHTVEILRAAAGAEWPF